MNIFIPVKNKTMKKKLAFIACLILIVAGVGAQVDSLRIHYYENYPFAYKEGGKLKGIEIDIVEEYVAWLKQKKNISVGVSYVPFEEFSSFYGSVKSGGSSVVGLGSVTDNAERENEVAFSPAYLQNVSVLVTDGSVTTIKNNDAVSVARSLNGMRAVVVNKSSHLKHLKKMYEASRLNDAEVKIVFTEKQTNVLDSIAANKRVFGYVDIVAYWAFVKKNPAKFLKIQKVLNVPNEAFGFIMPKGNLHAPYLSEFFESGFGFTSTKVYHQILEKYLGHEIIDLVEIK
jgi:ABC-type amino acid transport substrate-binding protein